MSKNQKQRNKNEARDKVSVKFTKEGWEDYCHWQSADLTILGNVNRLIDVCLRTPFTGIGKPEPLKGDLSGLWSRRITREHRLVYFFEASMLTVLQCRYHYDD
ncbi:TPA: Txe/YoeB family addiction module toxin [Pseudomonas putida]|uniref:Txe/YoeB family addiction module toxin n=1 Tax=Pseudomonas putida TaxID=303 RepID=UPI00236337B8|nr:Txe/YoeB family addiction module toxin [Pseudomonas putida]MDD2009265.1 Txe/YoeB family addiction module toxin [Pseudomonas putida]HDS1775993.1 Txe/YoeB family addiction module toxin [Pseudomonas putida]